MNDYFLAVVRLRVRKNVLFPCFNSLLRENSLPTINSLNETYNVWEILTNAVTNMLLIRLNSAFKMITSMFVLLGQLDEVRRAKDRAWLRTLENSIDNQICCIYFCSSTHVIERYATTLIIIMTITTTLNSYRIKFHPTSILEWLKRI